MLKGDLVDVYNSCMTVLNDAEYCMGVVEAVIDAASKRVYTYVPEGRTKPRFHIIRTHSDYYVKIYVDATKESVVLVLDGFGHMIQLYYKVYKGEGRRVVLENGGIVSLETMAMLNGYFEPPLDALKPNGGHEVR
jgi:hypothetical protein